MWRYWSQAFPFQVSKEELTVQIRYPQCGLQAAHYRVEQMWKVKLKMMNHVIEPTFKIEDEVLDGESYLPLRLVF